MSMTDPVADFLTRIRNAIRAAHEEVVIPSSKLKVEMIVVPMPPCTRGRLPEPAYRRWPGRDTRRRPEMAERRSSVYLSWMRRRVPGWSASASTVSKERM